YDDRMLTPIEDVHVVPGIHRHPRHVDERPSLRKLLPALDRLEQQVPTTESHRHFTSPLAQATRQDARFLLLTIVRSSGTVLAVPPGRPGRHRQGETTAGARRTPGSAACFPGGSAVPRPGVATGHLSGIP